MTASKASEFWKFRYDRTKNYVDEHWETSELKEHNEYVSALKTAIKALEKQIPKKPDYEDYDAKCPVCGHEFENNVNDWGCSYCQGCGQKLDWSDEF